MTPQDTLDVVPLHIEQTQGIRSGKPRIRGTRVTVADVVLWTERGMSPYEIVADFPQLGLGDVYAAMAYYHDNQEAIDRQIQESREFVSRMKAQLTETSNDNDEGTDADGNPVSS